MGNSNQNKSFLKKGQGLRILSIKLNSPFDGHVLPFFDFIVDIIPLQPSRSPKQILDKLSGQQPLNQPINSIKNDFYQIMNDNENKRVQFKIISTKERNIRSVQIIPNRNWNGSMDLTGIQAIDTYFPVTQIMNNSPMQMSGVKSGEYLLGCMEFSYSNLNNFIQGLYDRFFDKEVNDKNVHLALYDLLRDQLTIKPILLKRGWGGKGLLGCEFLQGQIYKFPQNWKERRQMLLLNQKKKMENQKLKKQLGECDGASKTLVQILKNKKNRKGKNMQMIKNMISIPIPQIPIVLQQQQNNSQIQNANNSTQLSFHIKQQNIKIQILQKRVNYLEQTLSNIKLYLEQISHDDDDQKQLNRMDRKSQLIE